MKKLFLFTFLTLLLFPTFARAATICDELTNATDKTNCGNCVNGDPKNVWTAIGCLRAGEPKDLLGQILGWAVIVGGFIAFMMIVYSGFQITTAAGDPKRVQAAQQTLVSAISGLLLIIFSIILLNFVGLNLGLAQWFNITL